MRIILVFIFSSIWMFGYGQTYDIVLATDFDGNVTQGSKAELITYIREGKPVRVGWQLDFDKDKIADFDHWVEATFITILGDDVFSQIDPIYTQGPNIDVPQLEIFSSNTKWTAIIGTNSKLLNRYVLDTAGQPALIVDDSLDIPVEEQQKQIDNMEKRRKEMKKVNTWNVATFWSVQK